MKNLKCMFRFFTNIQIVSALIWAVTIVLCGAVSDKNDVFIILMTAAGFHVVLMTKFIGSKPAIK